VAKKSLTWHHKKIAMKKLFNLCLVLLAVFAFSELQAQKDTKRNVVYEYPDKSVTQHSITINGQRINYTATTGHMLMLDEKGEEKSRVFYIAYTKNNVANPSDRALTFSFNGGPGSSSVWLHMGALGPKRVVMEDDGMPLPPPYKVVDNEFSWLDKTDLVFIDPVETGFSRPAEGVDKKEFTGYSEDLKSVGDFIHKYITENARWNSPKFLAGESYGTTRASGLSGYLQDRHGMYLNGLVLISAVLNFQTIYITSGNELPYSLFLPSFAATAYFHGKIDKARYPDFKKFLKEAEDFALGEYTLAMMKGDQLSEQDRKKITDKMSELMGLKKEFIELNNLRISTWTFTKELLRDESRTVGRFDGTVKGIDKLDAGTSYEFDPSYNLSIYGSYTMAVNDHFKRVLKYSNPDMVYEILTSNVRPWNYGNAQNQFLDNSETLRSSIHKNPHLKVLVCNGYYDLATPYFATEYTVNHMFLNKEYKNNIKMTYYEGGHMMYTIKKELEKFTRDVRQFYDEVLKDLK
jgi:carboxypeptidase C (cathepsin A)